MQGRCFDIEGHRWKTVTPLRSTSVQVVWAGFSAYTGTLREQGWEFVLVKNLFTKRTKLVMRNSALRLVGSGEYTPDAVVFVRSMGSEKVKGLSRLRTQNETIELNRLEISDVLEAVHIVQQRELSTMPKKPRPTAAVLKMETRHVA